MKAIASIAILLLFASATVSQAGPAEETGIGVGITLPGPDDNPCPPSDLMLNYDGSAENGYSWRGGGVVAPDYGAFAEGYEGMGVVCGMQFHLTQTGNFHGQTMDCYLYDSDGLNPNNILSATIGVVPDSPAFWPEISVHDLDTMDGAINGAFFVGYWGNWPGLPNGFYIAADLDGPGGMPRTNIAPGIGYPTGWNDPGIVWGPTMSLGIGAYWFIQGLPTETCSWGAVKALYGPQ